MLLRIRHRILFVLLTTTLLLLVSQFNLPRVYAINNSVPLQGSSVQKTSTNIPPGLLTQNEGGLSSYWFKAVKQRDAEVKAKALAKKLRLAKIAREKAALRARLARRTAPKPRLVIRPVYRSSAVSGCGDNSYAHFIYMHESGCSLVSVNAGGCRGIGQACPGSKLPCGADYTCQNAYFTNYANGRYGGWAGAYNFWLSHRWW